MRRGSKEKKVSGWDAQVCEQLIEQLWALRADMLACESELAPWLAGVDAEYLASARNFTHYLALRRRDIRPLQERLAGIGVSSLGRAESNVLANLDKVLGILHHLAGREWTPHSADEPAGIKGSRSLLLQHTAALFGAAPAGRAARIMVTLPSEAAGDFGLVKKLVLAGMDIARINCAHDTAVEWEAMAAQVRRAAHGVGRPVKILMDLGGPKLRTGDIVSGPAVLKLKPRRDALGRRLAPARIGLRAAGSPDAVSGAEVQASVDGTWLAALEIDDVIGFTDARGANRRLKVVGRDGDGVLAECAQTAYLIAETRFTAPKRGHAPRHSRLGDLPQKPGVLCLFRGNILRLTRGGLGQPGNPAHPASIACTLPEIFVQVRKGERVWFDDGRIGGSIRRIHADWIEVEITNARDGGECLAGDKGINLPDSQLDLPALTPKDLQDLALAVRKADLVGLSFAQRGEDVMALRGHLSRLGVPQLGVVVKIETRRGFENLPQILFAAMANRAAGVMIARGDLAVECGYERLAEVQEEILWATEAAHMPVIWATQVLETLAKTGLPSRAEITDAAMGERAECVMLNKGPHIVDAIRTLDDILKRMQAHQAKKRTLLRALHAWDSPNLDYQALPVPAPRPGTEKGKKKRGTKKRKD
ncbi:MAG: pyruvate kinase [Rhodocyclaceae bacterium]|nr:pyruvate kinase [Rhodocyclaceae bacterium]